MVHISVIYPSFAFGLRPILSYGGPKKKKKVRVQMRHKTGPKDYPLGDWERLDFNPRVVGLFPFPLPMRLNFESLVRISIYYPLDW